MTEDDKKILLAEMQKLTPPAQELLTKLIDAENNSPRVEFVDEKHRRFNGEIYTKHAATGYYMLNKTLHVEVYKYYSGLEELPKNCLVHHAGKDEHGNFDKEKNDIEYLQLMTRKDHTALHSPLELNQIKTFVCKNCGKEYQAKNHGTNCFCSKKCKNEWRHSEIFNETRYCKWCGKEFSTWKYGKKQFCSSHCAKLSQWAQMKSKQNSNKS